MADVQDQSMAVHCHEKRAPKLGHTAWFAGPASIAGSCPCQTDHAKPGLRPGSKLLGSFDCVGPFQQQHCCQLARRPRPYEIVQTLTIPNQLQADTSVIA